MQVRVCVGWKIIVDGNVNFLNVNTTAKDVCRNADTLLKIFEFFVAFDPFDRN